jgi:hypothetical protein
MFHDDWTVVTSDGFGTLKHQLHEAALSALRVQCDVVESSEVLAVGHKRPRALAYAFATRRQRQAQSGRKASQ